MMGPTGKRTTIRATTRMLADVTVMLMSDGETPSVDARTAMKADWSKLLTEPAIVSSDVMTGRKLPPGVRGGGGEGGSDGGGEGGSTGEGIVGGVGGGAGGGMDGGKNGRGPQSAQSVP